MSVRQAIAIAGGYDVMRTRMSNPYADIVEYQAQGAILARELAVEEERIKLLQAQLNQAPGRPSDGGGDRSRGADLPSDEINVVSNRIKLQQQDYEKQLRYILSAQAFASSRAAILSDQKSKEEEGSKADIEDFEKSKALLEKGTVSTQRVSEARRAMLLSSTRALQTAVEATRAQREHEQIARDSQQLQDQHKIRVLTDLQEAMSRRARISAQLLAAQQKMAVTGALKPSWSEGERPAAITLYRVDEKGSENRISASEEVSLMPGDVVEVSIKLPAF
jgi:polysaccharide export outer membrane protein